jgi:UPF0716 protein FxsA
MLRYLAALLLIPLLDALLLVVVATQIGGPLTILIVVLTALLGLLLVRAESRHTVAKIQRKLAAGEVPTNELLDGALLLVAGALTLTPGIVTDVVGIILIVPLTRIPIRALVRDYVVVPYMDKKSGGFATGNVYIGGFPFDDDDDGPMDAGGLGGMGGPGGPGGPGGSTGTAERSQTGDATYDLEDDAYDIDVDVDVDDEDGTSRSD